MNYKTLLDEIFEARIPSSQAVLHQIGVITRGSKRIKIDKNDINKYIGYWYLLDNRDIYISQNRSRLKQLADEKNIRDPSIKKIDGKYSLELINKTVQII